MRKSKKSIKKKKNKIKKLDDFKNQNLRVIFEDITSHKREVKEIEELTFRQLQNLREKLDKVIRKRIPINSFDDEESDEESKEEE